MNLILNNIDKGIYFVFYDNVKNINFFLKNFEDKIFVNLNIPNAIKVNNYFQKNNLNFSSNLIKSYSNAPQETFSVVIDLINNHDEKILVGTVGLSFDSIVAIYFELKVLLENRKKTVLIFHERKIKKGDYEIFNGELLNGDDIFSLFLNS